jgi:hypothetical protein
MGDGKTVAATETSGGRQVHFGFLDFHLRLTANWR